VDTTAEHGKLEGRSMSGGELLREHEGVDEFLAARVVGGDAECQ
jgi:hypothetical protein